MARVSSRRWYYTYVLWAGCLFVLCYILIIYSQLSTLTDHLHKSISIHVFQNIRGHLLVNSDHNNEGEIIVIPRIDDPSRQREITVKMRIDDPSRNEFQRRHYMTLAPRPMQLGNMMFQYASLMGIASRHGYTAAINQHVQLAKYFDIPNVITWKVVKTRKFREKRCCIYDARVDTMKTTVNYSISGYLQSWRYFDSIDADVRQALVIKDQYKREAKSFVSNVTIPGTDNVCVHVRRGDMVKPAVSKLGYAVAPLSYINNSMNYMRKEVKKAQFIILSNDISWCKANIEGSDVIYSPFGESAIKDMATMSLCDHVILTSGTFGWWGAWLAGGISVYYQGHPRPKSWLGRQTKNTDYYPPDWIGM